VLINFLHQIKISQYFQVNTGWFNPASLHFIYSELFAGKNVSRF